MTVRPRERTSSTRTHRSDLYPETLVEHRVFKNKMYVVIFVDLKKCYNSLDRQTHRSSPIQIRISRSLRRRPCTTPERSFAVLSFGKIRQSRIYANRSKPKCLQIVNRQQLTVGLKESEVKRDKCLLY